MRGRKPSPISIDTHDRTILQGIARSETLPWYQVRRARTVLAIAAGQRTTVVVCSGNHDLDHRDPSGEKSTRWLEEARVLGVAVDGDSLVLDGWLVTSCAWWEGPTTLAALEANLVTGRNLRDILSSPIMINNDRILANVASAALLTEVPASVRD